jgi:hypothetical protein
MMLLTVSTLADGFNQNSGVQLRNVFLAIIGTFGIIILAARSLAAMADERYGKMVTACLAAVPVFGIAYFPDQTLSILLGLWSAFWKG